MTAFTPHTSKRSPLGRRMLALGGALPLIAALGLGACSQQQLDSPTDRALGGALMTSAAGAAIGALADGGGGAALGALTGAAAGALGGWLTTPGNQTSNL
ncbi:hypothetical protein E3E12_07345 [Formicincola oecophyllae]|uniref:Glycine zipper domain-containing protein n=1 Tax=Formicincola oecophyllae TaxID=2558361 RepID=A0A4Y6U980_9PROT|nr:hypothetical protein [Formicincola oecophyllae]QDH14023.1 hypothetical protein E3E12_07345 [Formicincola oecophyllae]